MIITLDPESHTYQDELGTEYTSVTRLINKFVPSFDFEQKSKLYASKYGMDVEVVRESWAKKNKDSTDFGTKIHSFIETALNTKKVTDNEYKKVVKSIVDMLYEGFSGIYKTEKIISDIKSKVAGTADLIIEDDNTFSIVDFKTNKQIKYTNDFEDKFLFKPLSHLPNSEYFKYSLQLSFYAYFYNNITNKHVDRLSFFWLKRSDAANYSDLNNTKWLRYNVPYLKEEVESVLNYVK
jgi:ATP-dependent exoDNAse (exonuclease V) beta subunit